MTIDLFYPINSYPVKFKLAAQAESIGTLGRIMETFTIEGSNFKEGFLPIKMHSSIHGSDWSMHLDVWAAGYLFVLKLWQQPHVPWNNCRKDNKEVSYRKLASCSHSLPDWYKICTTIIKRISTVDILSLAYTDT